MSCSCDAPLIEKCKYCNDAICQGCYEMFECEKCKYIICYDCVNEQCSICSCVTDNKGIVCEDCLNICEVCESSVCELHTVICDNCDGDMCYVCACHCNCCGGIFCRQCSESDFLCSKCGI